MENVVGEVGKKGTSILCEKWWCHFFLDVLLIWLPYEDWLEGENRRQDDPLSRDDESLTKRGAMGMERRGQIWKICGICEWLYVKVVEEPDMFRLQILAGVALWMIVAQGDRKYRKYWGQGWSFSLGLNELVIEVWHWWAVRCISRESSGEETWPQVKAWKSLLAHWCYLESPE